MLLCNYFSTENIPGSEYAGTKGMYFSYFKRYCQTTLQTGFINSHSYQQYVTVPISPHPGHTIYYQILYFCQVDRLKKKENLIALLICISLTSFQIKRRLVIFCTPFVLILFLFSYCVDGLCVTNL